MPRIPWGAYREEAGGLLYAVASLLPGVPGRGNVTLAAVDFQKSEYNREAGV
jgi:hypothetical protein